jgi:hypothetical protein
MGHGIMEIKSKNWRERNEKKIINQEIPINKAALFFSFSVCGGWGVQYRRTYDRGEIAVILQQNTQRSNALPLIIGHQSMRKHPAASQLMSQLCHLSIKSCDVY